MLDATPAPDLDQLLAPGDQAEFIALCAWTTRLGRTEASWLYVVLQAHTASHAVATRTDCTENSGQV